MACFDLLKDTERTRTLTHMWPSLGVGTPWSKGKHGKPHVLDPFACQLTRLVGWPCDPLGADMSRHWKFKKVGCFSAVLSPYRLWLWGFKEFLRVLGQFQLPFLVAMVVTPPNCVAKVYIPLYVL